MNFEELNNTIPLAKGGKEKVLRYSPYPNVTIAMPGRHWEDTVPKGGDFVVMVTSNPFGSIDHQFTHTDIFKIVEEKYQVSAQRTKYLMADYVRILRGESVDLPFNNRVKTISKYYETMDDEIFLNAVQCLAVAEHRRYAQHEAKWGGRYLPFRFAAGIAQGLWTAADAANLQKKGRIGVEILEKKYGVPELTKELMQ
jgi:hypothetical protein